ncbi:aberrant root formation protein isoform X2 [Wolffia australiana]
MADPPSASERTNRSSSSTICSQLSAALQICSKHFTSGDFSAGAMAVSEVVRILNDQGESSPSVSEVSLAEIFEFLSSPAANEMTVDALATELPRVVVKFAGVSEDCSKYVEKIIDLLITACNPRDMLSIVCEALDSQIKVSTIPIDFLVLLRGLSKVITAVRRHHFQQIKVALPVVFKVIRAISSEFDEEDEASLLDFFRTVTEIGISIKSVCEKLEEEKKEELRALLSLYTLHLLAFFSTNNLTNKVPSCVCLVKELSMLFPFCGLSYSRLITGDTVESIIRVVCGEDDDDDDLLMWLPWAKGGACLAVVWGFAYEDVSKAAGEDIASLFDELRANPAKRWEAVGTLKLIFSSTNYSWKIKADTVEFLLNIMNAVKDADRDNDAANLFLMPSLFASLEGLQKVMMSSADATLRKKAFSAFRKVLADIPGPQRFDLLKALITHSSSPDMVHKEGTKQGDGASSYWTENALGLVEMVLRPPKGGPPSFPQDGVPVLAALNLYRFILIRASSGENLGSPVTASQLRKAYTDWLIPLRKLVTGLQVSTENEGGELNLHVECSFNPLQLVLYRCIELVENCLKDR